MVGAQDAGVGTAEGLDGGVRVTDEDEVDVWGTDHLEQPGRSGRELLGVVDHDQAQRGGQALPCLGVLLEQVGGRTKDPCRVIGTRAREGRDLVVLGQNLCSGNPVGAIMLKAQGRKIVRFKAALDRPHEQVPQLCAKSPGGQGRVDVFGPLRGLALARSVTGKELTQDEVLLGPAEQPGAGVTPQRRGLAQDPESERLVGAGQRFGRGAADPGCDAVSQIRGRSPRSREDEALVGRCPVTADPVDHDLDSRERLAGARSTQDAQNPCVMTLRGGSAVAGSVVDDSVVDDGVMSCAAMGDGGSLRLVQDRGLGTQTGSPSQSQHRQIPSRPTDGDARQAVIKRPLACSNQLRTHECPDREAGASTLQNRCE